MGFSKETLTFRQGAQPALGCATSVEGHWEDEYADPPFSLHPISCQDSLLTRVWMILEEKNRRYWTQAISGDIVETGIGLFLLAYPQSTANEP